MFGEHDLSLWPAAIISESQDAAKQKTSYFFVLEWVKGDHCFQTVVDYRRFSPVGPISIRVFIGASSVC